MSMPDLIGWFARYALNVVPVQRVEDPAYMHPGAPHTLGIPQQRDRRAHPPLTWRLST